MLNHYRLTITLCAVALFRWSISNVCVSGCACGHEPNEAERVPVAFQEGACVRHPLLLCWVTDVTCSSSLPHSTRPTPPLAHLYTAPNWRRKQVTCSVASYLDSIELFCLKKKKKGFKHGSQDYHKSPQQSLWREMLSSATGYAMLPSTDIAS